jgi:hypothetical protein
LRALAGDHRAADGRSPAVAGAGAPDAVAAGAGLQEARSGPGVRDWPGGRAGGRNGRRRAAGRASGQRQQPDGEPGRDLRKQNDLDFGRRRAVDLGNPRGLAIGDLGLKGASRSLYRVRHDSHCSLRCLVSVLGSRRLVRGQTGRGGALRLVLRWSGRPPSAGGRRRPARREGRL